MAVGGVKYEFRNWSGFYPSTIRTQFLRDLTNSNIGSLDDIKWIFNKTEGESDLNSLRSQVLTALKKTDDSPVDELENLFANDLTSNFPERMSNLFKKPIDAAEDLLEILNEPNTFNQIFEVAN